MTNPKTFHRGPDVVQAMQWNGTPERADSLWEWTQHVLTRKDNGSPHAVATDFMVLGEDDAYDVLGNDVEQRQAAAYTAVIRDRLHNTWTNLRTGDWIIKDIDGTFHRCSESVFAATYQAPTTDVIPERELTLWFDDTHWYPFIEDERCNITSQAPKSEIERADQKHYKACTS